jgi:predicted nucleic acid-binding protein
MPTVVDASVAVRWCLPDRHAPACDALLRRLESDSIVAPSVWILEVTNALVVAHRRRMISSSRVDEFLNTLLEHTIELESTHVTRVCQDVVAIATADALSVYDAAYLELAMRRGIELATLDEPLERAAAARGVALVSLR